MASLASDAYPVQAKLAVEARALPMDAVVLGAAWIANRGGVDLGQAAADECLAAACDEGIGEVDTAPLYGHGQSEMYLGTALAKLAAGVRARAPFQPDSSLRDDHWVSLTFVVAGEVRWHVGDG